MNCRNPSSTCTGVWNDIPKGIPPRGFYYREAPIKVLAVAKNPGHPLLGEQELYRGLTGKDLFQAYRKHQEILYPNPDQVHEPSIRFHKTLFRYLSVFLEIPQDDIYLHAAHTNLVKCSTPDERAKLDPKAMAQCYSQYFKAELDLLRPRVLLALGREVEKFLISRKTDHQLPVVYIKHPSYRYRKEDEQRILTAIKRQIHSFL